MKYKKVLSILIILVLLIRNLSYGTTDTNTDSKDVEFIGGSDYDHNYCWNYQVRGARVSLWNVEEQELIDWKNMITFNNKSYEEVSTYRCLSLLTKPEIIRLNYTIIPEIQNNYMEYFPIKDGLCENSINFPELFAKSGVSAEERTRQIKSFYQDKEKAKELLRQFSDHITEENIILWEEKKAVLLIEPLLCVYIGGQDATHTWLLTCAELGLLAYNGLAKAGEDFAVGRLYACYKHLPFGTFKENTGLITSILPYDKRVGSSDGNRACETEEDFKDMINCLGCLELSNIEMTSVARESIIEYYTNCWVVSSVDVYSEKGFPYQSDTKGFDVCSNGAKTKCLNGSGLAKITYTFNSDIELETNTYTQTMAIPEGGNALSWVKWKTPNEPCKIYIDIEANSDDALLSTERIEVEVIRPEDRPYPPNTKATDRYDDFIIPYYADGSWNIGTQKSLSWKTYSYNWHYDWHCICKQTSHGDTCNNEISLSEFNEYGSTGSWYMDEWYDDNDHLHTTKVYDNLCNSCSCNYDDDVSENHVCKHCNFIKEDWGWVEWTETTHTLELNTTNARLYRSENTPDTNNSDYSIKSGYGIELDVNTNLVYKKNGANSSLSSITNAIAPPQVMETFFPEYYYEMYEIISRNNLESGYSTDNKFNFPTNPYSQFEQNCHFTPIWYPNGKYVVGIKISQCFCPAGMIYEVLDNVSIDIKGNIYDDWHIAPE